MCRWIIGDAVKLNFATPLSATATQPTRRCDRIEWILISYVTQIVYKYHNSLNCFSRDRGFLVATFSTNRTHWSYSRTRPLLPDPHRSPPSCASRFRRFFSRSKSSHFFFFYSALHHRPCESRSYRESIGTFDYLDAALRVDVALQHARILLVLVRALVRGILGLRGGFRGGNGMILPFLADFAKDTRVHRGRRGCFSNWLLHGGSEARWKTRFCNSENSEENLKLTFSNARNGKGNNTISALVWRTRDWVFLKFQLKVSLTPQIRAYL